MIMNDDTDKQTAENGGDDRRGEAGRFAPGNAGGPGRPAGSPNKVSASIRELVERSIHERHPGGPLAWLNSLPDSLFVRLAAKLLPPSMTIEVGGEPIPLQIVMFGTPPSLEESPDGGEADTSARP